MIIVRSEIVHYLFTVLGTILIFKFQHICAKGNIISITFFFVSGTYLFIANPQIGIEYYFIGSETTNSAIAFECVM